MKIANPLLGEFQIDHVAILKSSKLEILNVKFRKSDFDSDHYLAQINQAYLTEKIT